MNACLEQDLRSVDISDASNQVLGHEYQADGLLASLHGCPKSLLRDFSGHGIRDIEDINMQDSLSCIQGWEE